MELSDVRHNEEVVSVKDPTMHAYFAGNMGFDPRCGEVMVMLVVKDPGQSGLSLYCNKPWPLSDLALPQKGGHK